MNTKLIASALLLSLPLTLAACNKKPEEQPKDAGMSEPATTTSPAESTSVDPNLANVAEPDPMPATSEVATTGTTTAN